MDGLERLGQGLLHDDQPAQRGNRCVRGEHPATLEILGLGGLFAGAATRGRRAGRLDLFQARQIALLEHEADVGMRDELAPGVDDVGVAGPPDLD
ncbi:MAG: hypothetical protein ACRDGH_11155, partial [Candidatus Limnocylindria bacterium]